MVTTTDASGIHYRIGDTVTLHQLGKPVTGSLYAVNSFAVYLTVGKDGSRWIEDYLFASLDERIKRVKCGMLVRDNHVRSEA